METFKSLIAEITKILKPLGFSKKGITFYYQDETRNWGLIDFQKSNSSTNEHVLFTINLGVCSYIIRKYFEGDESTKPPIEDCHFKKRVGFLLHQKSDYWWEINPNTKLETISNEIIALLKGLVIPELDKNITDESLEEAWLKGSAEGLTEVDRYINLTVLLKEMKKEKELHQVAAEFKAFSKGKAFESIARGHLKDIGIEHA